MEAAQKDAAVVSAEVSDMDYLKSRMRTALDDDDDDGGGEDKDGIEPDQGALKARQSSFPGDVHRISVLEFLRLRYGQ